LWRGFFVRKKFRATASFATGQAIFSNHKQAVSAQSLDLGKENHHLLTRAHAQRYESAGYKLPQICFWNVNGSIRDYPVQASTRNVSLVSGFSIDVLRCVLEDKTVTPETTMMAAIESPRYSKIKYIPQKIKIPHEEAHEQEGACTIY
jgi:hypothetical protein